MACPGPGSLSPVWGRADRFRLRRSQVQRLVEQGCGGSARERTEVPDPSVAPDALHELRAEGARGIHRGPRQRTADEDVERDREADREAGDRRERPARVGRRREDDPDEEEGQDRLRHERSAGSDSLTDGRRAKLRSIGDRVREDPGDEQRGENRCGELAGPVHEREARRHPSRDEKADRHGGIEVAARDVPDRRNHDRDREAVGQGDAGQRGIVACHGYRDRARSDEDEGKRPDELGNRAS